MATGSFHQSIPSADSYQSHDSKEEIDEFDDALRYNKRLKERRDRLLEQLTEVEQENTMHCENLRNLLKPLRLSIAEEYESSFDPKDKYSDDEDTEMMNQHHALDGIEEFEIPKIDKRMSIEQKRDFLSLLIRYLCLSNNYQRNEIKALYAKQTSLYFQAQGLSLDEQREFIKVTAFKNIKEQNNQLNKLLAKFPDPMQLSDAFEKYIKMVKDINIDAPDNGNWQNSAKEVVDEQKSMDEAIASYHHTQSSSSNLSGNIDNLQIDPSTYKKRKSKSFFGFAKVKRKSQENNADAIKAATAMATSTSMDSNQSVTSPQSISDASRGVARMGSLANAPSVSSNSRSTAIHGARLVRFDPNFKQLSSRRQRCDIAQIVVALQNTHKIYTKMKQKYGMQSSGNPFLSEQNFGFSTKTNKKMYTFDHILDDMENLHQYEEERKEQNMPMTPAMLPMKSGHFSGQSTLGTLPNLESLLSPSAMSGKNAGSSVNLRNMIYSTHRLSQIDDDMTLDDNANNCNEKDQRTDSTTSYGSSRPTSARYKTSVDMNSVFTQISKPVMSVKQKSKDRGWITLNQFIFHATNFAAHGIRDAQVLVLTHKTFCKSKELLKGLRKRFWHPIPPNITPSEVAAFRTTHTKQIRGKIMAVLRDWVRKHWNDDFRDDFRLQGRMNKFITEISQNEETEKLAIYLAQAFERSKKENPIRSLSDDQVKVAQNKKKVHKFFYDTNCDILDFKPEESAACITQLNCDAFLLIDQREAFEYIKRKEKAPHISKMIARWNAMGNWAQRELLSNRRDFKKRLQCLRYFIKIVKILYKSGDFSGAYALNSALHSAPIHRLKRCFAEISKAEQTVLDQMSETFNVSGNYPKLREKMKDYLSKPCVPHIGLFTRDLTMLAEQESTKTINRKKYVNYGKMQTLAKQIGDLKMFQNNINKFKLTYAKPLLDYVETQLEKPLKSGDELYKMSVAVEPKASRAPN